MATLQTTDVAVDDDDDDGGDCFSNHSSGAICDDYCFIVIHLGNID